MGRSRGGLIVAPSHIKMNKLLLALAIGLSLLALAAGSSEEENQVESFESGLAREAREADPANGQRKNQAKKKNQSKRKNQSKKNQAKRKNQDKRKNKKGNKKGRSNKRKGLKGKKGGKGQKGKRNNTWVVENPYYYQISSYATTIISVTAPVFTAADLTALSVVNTALQVSVTTLTVAVTTLQSTILELTGATVSDAELDALPSCEADPDVCYPDATTVGTHPTTTTHTQDRNHNHT